MKTNTVIFPYWEKAGVELQILQWDDVLNTGNAQKVPVALTIGVFDGLHLGHQKLLDAVNVYKPGITSCAVTFRNNPAAVLKADLYAGNINSYRQKVKNFQLYGIDLLISIDFSLNFSKISGKEFWNALSAKFDIHKIVVGKNFNFGYGRDTNIHNLSGMVGDCEVISIDPVRDKGVEISSTKIRCWIKQGEIQRVNRILFRNFSLDLYDYDQYAAGVYLDKKTIEQVVPDRGLYAIACKLKTGDLQKEGLLSIDDATIRLLEPGSIDFKNIQEIIFIEKRDERS